MRVPILNVRFEPDEFKQKSDKNKWKMRIKRALLFTVVLALLGSVYYVYSLHFKPTSVGDEAWEDDDTAQDNKRVAVDIKPKNRDTDKGPSAKTFRLFRPRDDQANTEGDRDDGEFPDFDDIGAESQSDFADFEDDQMETTKYLDSFFGRVENTDTLTDNEFTALRTSKADSYTSAAPKSNGGGSDLEQREKQRQQWELEKRLQEQQQLIQQQAEILKKLQEKLLGNSQQQDSYYQQPQQQQLQQQQQVQPNPVYNNGPQNQVPVYNAQQNQQLNQVPTYNNPPQNPVPVYNPPRTHGQVTTELPTNSRQKAALDRFQNFRGQIKGDFQGMLSGQIRDTNNFLKVDTHAGDGRVQYQGGLAQNAPFQRPPQGGGQMDDGSHERQVINAPQGRPAGAGQNRQLVDAAQMFADARNKVLSQISADGRSLNQGIPQIGKTSGDTSDDASMKKLVDAETQFQQARLKGLKVVNEAASNRNDQNGQQDPRAGGLLGAPGRYTGKRELQIPDTDEVRAAQRGYQGHQDQFGRGEEEAQAAWNEEQVEEAIDRMSDDPLLRDHFEMVKDRIEELPPGIEPEVDMDDRENAVIDDLNRKPIIHVNVYDLTQMPNGTFQCVQLRLSVFSRTICVHPHGKDSEQSEHLVMSGTWEEQELDLITRTLRADSSLGLVDLGAGLGVYTVAAVAEGRQVLAVEPLQDNVRLLHKTIQLNSGTNRVVLVTDALGERPGIGKLLYPHPIGNMGAVYVKPLQLTEVRGDVTDLVQIVRLDDLLPLTSYKRAVMKLDVQGDENLVLKGAAKYFERVDIPYVFMHWFPAQNPSVFSEAGALLSQWGYEAAESPTGRTFTVSELSKDINFVVWRKTTLEPQND